MPSISDNLAEGGLTSIGSTWRILLLSATVSSRYTFRREGLEQSPEPVNMFRSMSSIIIQAELLPQRHSKSRENYYSEDPKLVYKEFLLK